MIVQLENQLGDGAREAIERVLYTSGYKVTGVKTQYQEYLIAVGSSPIDIRSVGSLEGVKDIHIVSDSYQLVSRKWKTKATHINLGDGLIVGESSFQFMAGPCSIEGEDQVEAVANHLVSQGVRIMRGGVFKPRTSPYSYRGGGLEALNYFHSICAKRGIKIISEVLEPSQIEPMSAYTDIFQVGARNAQNFSLLNELGKVDKPVLLKRGISGTIDELLQSAEYVFSAGNERILLCERGIRSFEGAYRNTFDINAVTILKDKTHLPVIVDPSHGVGIRKFVEPVGLAAIMAGADGMLVEIHPRPELAMSDGDQTLNFEESSRLFKKGREVLELRERLKLS